MRPEVTAPSSPLPADPLAPALRRQVEQLVRPLYVGLDGAAGFDRVSRLERHAAALAAEEGAAAVDPRLLALLLLFHGVVDRLGSLGPGGRLDLLLRGAGVGDELARRVRSGLARLASPSPLPASAPGSSPAWAAPAAARPCPGAARSRRAARALSHRRRPAPGRGAPGEGARLDRGAAAADRGRGGGVRPAPSQFTGMRPAKPSS
jgi:hypothetical protein